MATCFLPPVVVFKWGCLSTAVVLSVEMKAGGNGGVNDDDDDDDITGEETLQ